LHHTRHTLPNTEPSFPTPRSSDLNELLTDEDYSQIAKTKVTVQPKKKPLDKSSLDKINQQKIQQAKRSMEYHADPNTPMFQKSEDRKSTRLNSCHVKISYAVFCLK